MLKEPPRVCRVEAEYMPHTSEKAERCRIGASCSPWRPCKDCPNYITDRDREMVAKAERLLRMGIYSFITPNEIRAAILGEGNER